jgi:hypothetical protein
MDKPASRTIFGLVVYAFAVAVCLYLLLPALLRGREVPRVLHFCVIAPPLAFFVFRLICLARRGVEGRK